MAAREHVASRLADLAPGSMAEVTIGSTPVLLVRHGTAVAALGARCPHHGAPLAEGVLAGDRIVCPWHHACFHARTGAVLEPPALDGLARFASRIEDGRILGRCRRRARRR
jgi:nitrite reductase/ring-hydroxylating ferredoxin subunit